MDRAPLIHLAAGWTVMTRGIAASRFIIPADSHPGLRFPHASEDGLGKTASIREVAHTGKILAACAEIKLKRWTLPYVRFDHSADGVLMFLKLLQHACGLWADSHPARV